jgi:hypothetical protein
MGKALFFKSRIVWYIYLNIFILLSPVLIISYLNYIDSKKTNIYLILLIILSVTFCAYYLKYFIVWNNRLCVVRPFWIKSNKVYLKNEIENIRFYNVKSGNFGGEFVGIEMKNKSKNQNIRIELSKEDKLNIVCFLNENNYNVSNEL